MVALCLQNSHMEYFLSNCHTLISFTTFLSVLFASSTDNNEMWKYGQDFGLIEEECFPYEERDMPCKQTTCQRHYTRDYYYIDGYYGACNEPLMREELVKNGPITMSFEVYKDFTSYKGGIYHHTGVEDKFNPWDISNHVVLVVGYGEEMGQPYWIVKTFWVPELGEDGFFRIRRDVDEFRMESMAVGTIPVV